MPGRRPIPDEIKRLRGNPGKRKLSSHVQMEAAIPSPPAWLKSPVALAEWERVSRLMFAMQLITELDQAVLASYCYVYGELDLHTGKIRDEPEFNTSQRGAPTENARNKLIRAYLTQLQKLSDDLGLTPTQRPRLRPLHTNKRQASKETTLAEKLFNGTLSPTPRKKKTDPKPGE